MKTRLLICLLISQISFFVVRAIDSSPDIVYEKKYTHLDITLLGSKLSLIQYHDIEKKFHRNFEKHAKESIFYSDFDAVRSLEAETRIPHKNKFKTITVKQTETSDIFQPGIFYGGYKNLHFVYPQLQPDAIGKLKYKKSIKDPHFILPFYFQEAHPVKHSEFSVSFPKNVKIRYELYGENTDQIQMTTQEQNGTVTYHWLYKEVPGYKFEQNAPSRSHLAPHIIILIDSYSYNNQTVSVSSNVADLYRWYGTLIEKISPCDEMKLKEQLKQIISNPMSKEDSVKTVFNWVQKNIKYIAFEDGMAGFIPRNACDVINKRYGDCKDMANLLKSLYDLMGIDAHLTWIGTRKKPYSYETLPSTITDNHMICSITDNEKIIFLDATNPYADFGLPTSMIQGKEALIGLNNKEFKVKKVPIAEADRSVRSDLIRCELNDNDLTGVFSSELTGYIKEKFQFGTLKAEVKKEKEFLRDHAAIGENNIEISTEKITGLSKPGTPGKIHFDFNMPGYARSIGDKYYVNLNLHKLKVNEGLDENNRSAPLEEDFKYLIKSKVLFEIPDGYEISYMPKNQKIDWSYGFVETHYEIHDQSISYHKTYGSNFLLLNPSDFSEWNVFLNTLSEINQETIILKKIN